MKNKYADPNLELDKLRYDLYTNSPTEIIKRLDYHRSLFKLSRSIGLISLIWSLIAISCFDYLALIIILFLLVICLVSFVRRIRWYNKSTYYAWDRFEKKEKKRSNVSLPMIRDIDITCNLRDERILIFAGGTGFRGINRELCNFFSRITRVVPIYDNGGSSKILREKFNIMPIGDIRNALITMTSHKGEIRKIVKLFNWRLPTEAESDKIINDELKAIAAGKHPLINEIEVNLQSTVRIYLNKFLQNVDENFILKDGSIGNFILVGAYLCHNNDINSAIYIFRQLCQIQGNVLPVALENNLHLGAILNERSGNKKIILGQEKITKLDRDKIREPIDEIFITTDLKNNSVPKNAHKVNANPMVLEEIKNTNMIIYGPGSFFTSLMPHFLTEGLVDEISNRSIPKILIANLTESEETYNQTLEDLLNKLFELIKKKLNHSQPLSSIINIIIVNKPDGRDFIYGSNRKYLPQGNILDFQNKYNIKIVEKDFEDPWNRGIYDPNIIVNELINIMDNQI